MSRRSPIPPGTIWHPARAELRRAYRIDPRGIAGPTRGQVDGPYWRAVAPAWFLPVEPPHCVEQRIVEASYRVPPDGGVTGWAALRWLGGRWFTGEAANGALLDVPITMLGACRRQEPGLHQTKDRLLPEELISHHGLRITTAVRSVTYEMRHAASLEAAVTALDMACFNDLVSLAEVGGWVREGGTRTGIQQARDAVALADENAWSPAEVAFRLLWTRTAGLGPVRCNVPIFDLNGRHLITPDLLDAEAGIVGEYQGEHHFERAQRRRDITRETLLRDHGLEYVERVAGEDPARFLIRLRSAYLRAARQPVAPRRWTLTAPPSWTSTETVTQRRSLSPHQRAVLLAHRHLDQAA